ncbi:hypothetical protein C1645_812787 [Glomus cerebriforme]|uniref:Uncharacterized protein n=1 Tax=Glomus cerebriforme TaxID=658196 RepID=A0A397TPC7_9GLOM|nr:hypothetical protein C1645_812787 [Glomus cerebriforme]
MRNYGTGKTTVVQQCTRNVRKGVIYINVSPILDNFIDNLAKAIEYSFKEISIGVCSTLTSYFIAKQPKFFRVLNVFERGARKYKANNSKPPVLILDNIKRSSWSCSDQEPIVIGDLTNKEAFIYLHEKLGGRIYDLKTYGDKIKKEGVTFEVVHKIVLGTINHNFHQAQMMKGERNHIIGKIIIQELVKNKKIHFDTFIELVNNEQIADELLQANVFSYNPESSIITFQSQATEVFVKENPELKSKEVFS